jgi:hypothetical protein
VQSRRSPSRRVKAPSTSSSRIPKGRHVKAGTVVLEGPKGVVALSIDPATRRFRRAGLAPGDYHIQAEASEAGRGSAQLTVRARDVVRAILALDGSAPEGVTTVRFALKGTKAKRVAVRATDASTGRVVFEKSVPLTAGRIELNNVPFGVLHWDFDDGSAKSCYNSDVGVLTRLKEIPILHLIPQPDPDPDPPEKQFAGLPVELAGVARVLPRLGIHSMEDLAAAEPEDLMHRALGRRVPRRSTAGSLRA